MRNVKHASDSYATKFVISTKYAINVPAFHAKSNDAIIFIANPAK